MEDVGNVVLRGADVTKTFGHVEALRGVDFEIRKGEIVGLVGDNGAGKSTLVGVVSGAILPTSGLLEFEAKTSRWPTHHMHGVRV